MDKAGALKLLNECLKEISHLKELHHDNPEYEKWSGRVGNIIKAGLDAEDVKTFLAGLKYLIVTPRTSEGDLQKHYLWNVNRSETNLELIIQKYEMEDASIVEAGASADEELNYLFAGMQFHPKVVKASKSLFETGHYAQAIFEAFKAVNNFVKQKTGLSLDGKDLMAHAFREENPVVRLNEAKTQSDKDEQEGFKFLFMGAMVGIRNPKAHDNVVQTNPYRTLEYLGFASLLMKRIEEGKVKQSQ